MSSVEIKLNGKVETLRPLLAAGLRVNDEFGGYPGAIARIQAGDLRAYISIVAAGLNKKKSEVEDAVFLTGLPALAREMVDFINLLANGGKLFKPKKLKTIEIEGKVYAEVDGRGEPVYFEEEPAGDETAGEG